MFFCCNFFRSYFSSSVNSSTSPSFYPFLGLFVLMAVRSPTSVGLYMYLFFCRPSFYCRSVIFLVQLSFSLSARQSVCSFLSSSSSALLPGYYFFCLPVLLTNRDCCRLFLCTFVRLSVSLILSAWNLYVIL